jgi:hypothetical protein
MSGEPEMEMELYTLCLEGTAIAICALERNALKEDERGVICGAFFEAWSFGGGDLMQLTDRDIRARRPTRKEGKLWRAIARKTCKPYVVLWGGGEARGAA